jgi:hypothetical protein
MHLLTQNSALYEEVKLPDMCAGAKGSVLQDTSSLASLFYFSFLPEINPPPIFF